MLILNPCSHLSPNFKYSRKYAVLILSFFVADVSFSSPGQLLITFGEKRTLRINVSQKCVVSSVKTKSVAETAGCAVVILYSKLNQSFFGCFDPTKFKLYNKNTCLLGWLNRCIGWHKIAAVQLPVRCQEEEAALRKAKWTHRLGSYPREGVCQVYGHICWAGWWKHALCTRSAHRCGFTHVCQWLCFHTMNDTSEGNPDMF